MFLIRVGVFSLVAAYLLYYPLYIKKCFAEAEYSAAKHLYVGFNDDPFLPGSAVNISTAFAFRN